VVAAGIEAKGVFVEEFYRPSLAAVRARLARAEAGEIPAESIPLNLLYLIATGADEGYRDEATAIREAILFFVAATGTSVQAVLSTVFDLSAWFAAHPEDRPLIEDLDFISDALQESLRRKAPYVAYVTRLATEDIDTSQCPIKAGDQIHAKVPMAGRDTSIFGPDAAEFNPKRPQPEGFTRYGFAFGSGAHQCLGLRVVLGNDGKSGSHIRLLQRMFQRGVKIDPAKQPELLPMRTSGDIPTYVTFPVIFTNWSED
jgi:cytochrome P450